jgi:hypothetical protein
MRSNARVRVGRSATPYEILMCPSPASPNSLPGITSTWARSSSSRANRTLSVHHSTDDQPGNAATRFCT